MIFRLGAVVLLLAWTFVRPALAADPLLELAEDSIFPDSPHRLSAEHNIGTALTKLSVLDPSKNGLGAVNERAEYARTMSQMAAGYMQLGASSLAVPALRRASELSKQYLFEYAEALYLAGETEQASTLFDQALAANPDDSAGALSAAFYFLMENKPDRAIPLLRAVTQGTATSTNRAYAVVFSVLAAKMQRTDLREAIVDLPGQANSGTWPLELRDALISGPSRGIGMALKTDRASFQDRLCEALFYVGFGHEASGKLEQAQRYYRASLDTRASGIRAYAAARVRLTKLLLGSRKTKIVVPGDLSWIRHNPRIRQSDGEMETPSHARATGAGTPRTARIELARRVAGTC